MQLSELILLVANLVFSLTTIGSPHSLNSSNVTQTPCVTSETTTAADTIWFFGYPWTPFFVPMGSEHLYRSYAEVLLGRPAQNESELKAMNLRIQFVSFVATYTIITTGYGSRLWQQCLPALTYLSFTEALCIPVLSLSSAGVMLDGIRSSYDRVVWQDAISKTVLITRCINERIADWKVLSLQETLSAEIQGKIMARLDELHLRVD